MPKKKTSKQKSTRPGRSNVVSFLVTNDGPSHITEAAFNTQNLVYEAWDTPNNQKRMKLAHQALALWPDCADAYLLLAEES